MVCLENLHANQACQIPRPVSLVLSGGSALGSYQAGVTYFITQALKSERNLYEIKGLAGGSSGAINAALSVSLVCGSRRKPLSEQELYQFWSNVNLSNFASTDFVENFSQEVKKIWASELKNGCDLVLSIPISKLNPEEIKYSNGLSLSKPSEAFTFRISQKNKTHIYNYINPSSSSRPIVADLNSNFDHDFNEVKKIVVASMSFPFLFSPQKINYCRVHPESSEWMHSNWPFECKKTKSDYFLDGVIYLKEPIDDMIELANSALIKNCETKKNKWLTIPPTLQHQPPQVPDALFINISTKKRQYQGQDKKNKSTSVENTLQVFNNYYYANKDVELIKLLELYPSMQDRLFITKNYFPRTSEHMFDFFGFSSSEFLKFDFLLGMLEGQIFYERHLAGLNYIKQRDALFIDKKLKKQFECLQAGLLKAQPEKCEVKEKNFLILAQLTTDLIYNECRDYKAVVNNGPEHRLCRKAQKGEAPFSWSEPKKGWEKNKIESYFQYKIRRLQELGFEFESLGLVNARTQMAPLEIKKRIQQQIGDLQESSNISKVSSIILDSLEYYPDQNYSYVLVGNKLEFGYKSNKLLAFNQSSPYWSSLLGLQVGGWQEWLEFKNSATKSYTLLYGIEKQLNTSTAVLQTDVGFRLGYQFSSKNISSFSGCAGHANNSRHCKGLVLQPSVRFTYLDTFNMQFALERKLFSTPDSVKKFQFQVGMGFKF